MKFLSSADLMQKIYEELKRRIGTRWVGLPKQTESVEELNAYSRPGRMERIVYCHTDILPD